MSILSWIVYANLSLAFAYIAARVVSAAYFQEKRRYLLQTINDFEGNTAP